MVSSSKSKEERRLKAQELARKANKSRDWFKIGTILGVIVAVLGIGSFLVVQNLISAEQRSVDASEVTPAGTINDGWTITKDGLVDAAPYAIDTKLVGSGYTAEETNITMYVDYSCPHCAEFDEFNIDQIKGWLQDGTIDSVSIHPIVFLSPYSLSGFNAMACTAEYAPEQLLDVHQMLLASQKDAASDSKLVKALYSVGVPESDDYAKCVRGGKYGEFASEATERAQTGPIPNVNDFPGPISGTPSIFVNGEKYPGNPEAAVFADYVNFIKAGGKASDITDGSDDGDSTDISSEN